ncbi:hypothetical protein [Mammaliicoccus sp. E-M24]|uniref:hypothetical protein n=1 Tax=Mammaliicoccus sp. E-M24 TaxID=2898684 RepID=UPI001EFA9705|nr:hypothetical protein [Mammaliicoccus sp. E-M24]
MKEFSKEELKELFTTVQNTLIEMDITDDLMLNDMANSILIEHSKEYQERDNTIKWAFIDLNYCILSKEETVQKYKLIDKLNDKQRELVKFLRN